MPIVTPTPLPSMKMGNLNFQGASNIYNFKIGDQVVDNLGDYLKKAVLSDDPALNGFINFAREIDFYGDGNPAGYQWYDTRPLVSGTAFYADLHGGSSANPLPMADFVVPSPGYTGANYLLAFRIPKNKLGISSWRIMGSTAPNATPIVTLNRGDSVVLKGQYGLWEVLYGTKGDVYTDSAAVAAVMPYLNQKLAKDQNLADLTDKAAARANLGVPTYTLTANPFLSLTNGNFATAYTPENAANKTSSLSAPNNTAYPTSQAVVDAIAASEARAKAYADAAGVSATNWAGKYSAAGNPGFPTTGTGSSGGIRRGDMYVVEGANLDGSSTVGGGKVDNGDVLIANQATPGQLAANWSVLQANTFQATENTAGTMKIAAGADVQNDQSTNDTDAVTIRKLWMGFARFLGLNNTWGGKQTFTRAPRFSAPTPGGLLKLDANGDLATATAADVAATGGAAAGVTVTFTDVPSYTVTHGKARYATVTLWDADRNLMMAPISYAADLNSFTVYFNENTTGNLSYTIC